MSLDTSLITFRAISTFANELSEIFGSFQRSLKLYCRLINKTTIAHDKPIQKHIDAFRTFCVTNRESILSKDASKLVMNKIEYSNRVFIDMNGIFKAADKETTSAIWNHLLTISALVDPTGKAKEVLKDSVNGQEANFLTDIINKVEEHVDPNANPMEAVASIMKSGVFTDLIGGMNNGLQDGSLDLGKLMGTVQSMVASMGGQAGGTEGGDDAMKMLTTMMGSMNSGAGGAPDLAGMLGPMMSSMGAAGGAGGAPDLAGMLGPMMGALGGASKPTLTIEEHIDAQVAASKEADA